MYNYYESVKDDVNTYFNDTLNAALDGCPSDAEELEENIYNLMWLDDSITGNGSGSYTFNTYKAEENLCHNWELIEEVALAYGYEPIIKSGWEYGAEWWDVSIRCYLLGDVLHDVMTERAEEYERYFA